MSLDARLVSMTRQHLMDYTVPDSIYKELYDKLEKAEFFFIPIVIKDRRPKIYFEKQSDPKAPAICRIFWRPADVKLYVKRLNTLGYQDGEVVGWENTPEAIISSVISAWTKLHGLRVDVVASVYHDNEFRDVERFWTSNEDSMV